MSILSKSYFKKHMLPILFVLLLISLTAVLLFPRRTATPLLRENAAVEQITVLFTATGEKNIKEVVLTEEQKQEFLDLLGKSRCYLRPFGKKYNNGGPDALDCLVLFQCKAGGDKVPPSLDISTVRSFSVNGISYGFYGTALTDYIKELSLSA